MCSIEKKLYIPIVKKRESILRVKEEERSFPVILIGNKCDLQNSRMVTYEEASSQAAKWKYAYIETSAKIKTNVDKAFSEIFINIKDLKEGKKLMGKSTENVPKLSKEVYDEVRKDSKRKRIRKFYKNTKKRCIIM